MCYYLPHSINAGKVGVGGQLQGGVCGRQGEHAEVERLLGEGVVGGVILTWHHINWN